MPPQQHSPSGAINIGGYDNIPIRTIFHELLIIGGGACVLFGTGSRITIATTNTVFDIVESRFNQNLSPKNIDSRTQIFSGAKNRIIEDNSWTQIFRKEFNKPTYYKNMVRVGWPMIGVGVVLKVGDHLGTTIYNKLFTKKLFAKKLDQKADS